MHLLTHDGWRPDNRKQRLLAAIVALALTAWLGRQLNGEPGRWQQHSLLERIGSVNYLAIFNVPPAANMPDGVPDRIPDKAHTASHAHAANKTAATAGHAGPVTTIAEAPAHVAPAAEAALELPPDIDRPGSGSHLKLDGKAIARAYRDGRSDLHKMADAAGKTLELPPLGKMQKFDAAMAEAAVPDCFALGQDPLKHNPPKLGQVALSGLLVIPFYVEAIAKGKCK
ncbi:MAG: hypothetical protein V4488_12555 [Pseudomonadota bacterium]